MGSLRAISAFAKRVLGMPVLAALAGSGMGLTPGSRPGRYVISDEHGNPAYAYEAGKITRLDSDFLPAAMGPNGAADRYLDLIWRRVRWLTESNPLLTAARDTWRRETVGKGLWLQPNTRSRTLNAKLQKLFWRRAERADVARDLSIFELQGVLADEIFTGGEAIAHFPITGEYRGAPAGVAVELIASPERMPLLMEGTYRGNEVRQGVEFDAIGRRVAYHVLERHPSDGYWRLGYAAGFTPGAKGVRRLPLDVARLCMLPHRSSQLRGVPWAAAAVNTARLADSFAEAEILLARSRACIGLAIKGLPPNGQETNPRGLVDADGMPITELSPGMIGYYPAGTELATLNPTTPGATLNSTAELLHRLMAAGLGVGYGTLTRDRSKSTFSADRADRLQDRAGFEEFQERVLFAQLMRPWWRRVLEVEMLAGRLDLDAQERALLREDPEDLYECVPIGKGMEYVNPKDDATANETDLRSGVRSLAEICGERGVAWTDVLSQRIEEEVMWNQLRASAGLEPKPLHASDGVADKSGADKTGDAPAGGGKP